MKYKVFWQEGLEGGTIYHGNSFLVALYKFIAYKKYFSKVCFQCLNVD